MKFSLSCVLSFRAVWLIGLCLSAYNPGSLFADDSKVLNAYRPIETMPPMIKRVVVLPLAHVDGQADLEGGCEILNPVFQAELTKTKAFEVVVANPQTVQQLTGQTSWTGAEVLPAGFFESLRNYYGADAVLFCQLTTFHAYPPIIIGWRTKLVDVTSQQVVWAADEVFDSSDPAVNKAAVDFQKRQQGTNKPISLFGRLLTWLDRQPAPATDDQWAILNSPSYFGQFSADSVLSSLPKR